MSLVKKQELGRKGVYFSKLFNGTIGEVVGIDHEKKVLQVRLPAAGGKPERVVDIDTEQYKSITHAYALTNHSGQGVTEDASITVIASNKHVGLKGLYVALSRQRHKADVVALEHNITHSHIESLKGAFPRAFEHAKKFKTITSTFLEKVIRKAASLAHLDDVIDEWLGKIKAWTARSAIVNLQKVVKAERASTTMGRGIHAGEIGSEEAVVKSVLDSPVVSRDIIERRLGVLEPEQHQQQQQSKWSNMTKGISMNIEHGI